MPNLSEIPTGSSGKIKGYEHNSNQYRKHLLALGLTPGTHFVISRVAPLGDPIEIKVRGCAISLRKAEAAVINVVGEK
ncbi:MAG: Fe(2+) transport protein A [Candidatus Celerinatantimonas neptuna]|nr:MAG: Fe(2+) transport protein A [Candidatus Celerinatantimonas neptuna]